MAVKDSWDKLLKVMPEWTSSRILDGLPSIYNEVLGNDIEKFVKSNPLPSAEKITKQKIERLMLLILATLKLSEQYLS